MYKSSSYVDESYYLSSIYRTRCFMWITNLKVCNSFWVDEIFYIHFNFVVKLTSQILLEFWQIHIMKKVRFLLLRTSKLYFIIEFELLSTDILPLILCPICPTDVVQWFRVSKAFRGPYQNRFLILMLSNQHWLKQLWTNSCPQ